MSRRADRRGAPMGKARAIGITSDDVATIKAKVAQVCGARTEIRGEILSRVLDGVLRKLQSERIENVEAFAHKLANEAVAALLVREPRARDALAADPAFMPEADEAFARMLLAAAPPGRRFKTDPWHRPLEDEDDPRIVEHDWRSHREHAELVATVFYDRVARLAIGRFIPGAGTSRLAILRIQWLTLVGDTVGSREHRRSIVEHFDPDSSTAPSLVRALNCEPRPFSVTELALISLAIGSRPIELVEAPWTAIRGVTPKLVFGAEFEPMKKAVQRSAKCPK